MGVQRGDRDLNGRALKCGKLSHVEKTSALVGSADNLRAQESRVATRCRSANVSLTTLREWDDDCAMAGVSGPRRTPKSVEVMSGRSWWCILILPAVLACSGSHDVAAPEAVVATLDGGDCPVEAPHGCSATPSYQVDIQPILETYCNYCHSESVDGGPWPLGGYDNVHDWSEYVLSDILDCSALGAAGGHLMPPENASVPLPPTKRATLMNWLLCGAPNN